MRISDWSSDVCSSDLIALNRKGIDWNHRMMAQADYQRTNGTTTVQKFIAEYEQKARLGDRAFAFGLGRWERDKLQGFGARWSRSEEHKSEIQTIMRLSYAVFCLKTKKKQQRQCRQMRRQHRQDKT